MTDEEIIGLKQEIKRLREGLLEIKRLYPRTPYKGLNELVDRLLEGGR